MRGEATNGATDEMDRFGPDDVSHAVPAFRRDGVVVLDGIFERARLVQLLDRLAKLYPDYAGRGIPQDAFEVGKLRFHAPLSFAPPFDCADIIAHPVLDQILATLLGEDFVFESFGVITSLPGADEQHNHCDGGLLFPETGIDRLAPPSAITVAIPLVDANAISGTTRFWLGSHRADLSTARAAEPELPVGSMAIWDYRVFHCGMPNKGSAARPYLYLTVCRPFWIDHKNFEKRRDAKLLASRAAVDKLDDARRRRFVRAAFSE